MKHQNKKSDEFTILSEKWSVETGCCFQDTFGTLLLFHVCARYKTHALHFCIIARINKRTSSDILIAQATYTLVTKKQLLL